MTWTTARPTKAGWYWWRRPMEQVQMARVFDTKEGLFVWLPDEEDRDQCCRLCGCWADTEWSSTPIAMPTGGNDAVDR